MRTFALLTLLFLIQTPSAKPRKSATAAEPPPASSKNGAQKGSVADKKSKVQTEPRSTSASVQDKHEHVNVIFPKDWSPHKDSLDTIAQQATIALAIVGIIGTFVAVGTLWVLKNQTDLQIASQRAWLILRPDTFDLAAGRQRFDWVITNAGKTTAFLTAAQVRCRKCAGMEKLLESSPDFGRGVIEYHNVPIAAGESLKLWSYIETGGEADDRLTDDDVARIRNSSDDLIAYGFVKYCSFEQVRESRFCYRYEWLSQDFRINLLAPAEYHKCT